MNNTVYSVVTLSSFSAIVSPSALPRDSVESCKMANTKPILRKHFLTISTLEASSDANPYKMYYQFQKPVMTAKPEHFKSYKVGNPFPYNQIRDYYTRHGMMDCLKNYSKPSNLTKGVVSLEIRMGYPCSKCPRLFTDPMHLTEHALSHLDSNYITYPCTNDCGKVFNHQNELKLHYKDCETNPMNREASLRRNFKLSLEHTELSGTVMDEEEVFVDFEDVLMPLNNSLENDQALKKHECKTCGKRFSRSSSLKVHLNSHTHAETFPCPCGRAFTTSSNLKRHLKKCKQDL